jgi:hypothetical protein
MTEKLPGRHGDVNQSVYTVHGKEIGKEKLIVIQLVKEFLLLHETGSPQLLATGALS